MRKLFRRASESLTGRECETKPSRAKGLHEEKGDEESLSRPVNEEKQVRGRWWIGADQREANDIAGGADRRLRNGDTSGSTCYRDSGG